MYKNLFLVEEVERYEKAIYQYCAISIRFGDIEKKQYVQYFENSNIENFDKKGPPFTTLLQSKDEKEKKK